MMSDTYVRMNGMTGSLNMDTLRTSLVENAILLPYSVASTPSNMDLQAHSYLFDDDSLSNSALEFLGLRPRHDSSSTNNSVQTTTSSKAKSASVDVNAMSAPSPSTSRLRPSPETTHKTVYDANNNNKLTLTLHVNTLPRQMRRVHRILWSCRHNKHQLSHHHQQRQPVDSIEADASSPRLSQLRSRQSCQSLKQPSSQHLATGLLSMSSVEQMIMDSMQGGDDDAKVM